MAEAPPQTRAEELFEAARAGLEEQEGEVTPKVWLVVSGFPEPFQVDLMDWYETDPAIISARRVKDRAQVLFGEDDLKAVLLVPPREPMVIA